MIHRTPGVGKQVTATVAADDAQAGDDNQITANVKEKNELATSIEPSLIENLRWIRPYFNLTDLSPLTAPVISLVAVKLTNYVRREDAPLCAIASLTVGLLTRRVSPCWVV